MKIITSSLKLNAPPGSLMAAPDAAKVREENALLRAVLASITDCYIALDDFWCFQEINDAAEVLLGRKRSDLYGRNLWQAFPQLVKTSAYELLHNAVQDRVVLHFEDAFPQVAAWVEFHVHPHAQGLVLYLRDQSARHAAQLSAERLAAVTEHNPVPMFELSREGEVLYANRRAEEVANSIPGSSPADLLPAHCSEIVRRCVEQREPHHGESSVFHGRSFSWSFFPAPAGLSAYVCGAELTDQLRLQSQLLQAKKTEAIGQLAAGIAHDFNSLLTVIDGFVAIIMETDDAPVIVKEAAQQIGSASERAAKITRQILTFGRRQRMNLQPMDLGVAVAEAQSQLQHTVGPKVRVVIDTPGHTLPMTGDRGMIEQVITNLALNARDAMPDGGEVLLRLRAVDVDQPTASVLLDARPGKFARLQVRDTGHGMDEDTVTQIFDPFFTTKPPGEGTGMGLSIVLGAVKQHSGWITVQSERGHGTTISVFFPLSLDQLPVPAPAHTPPPEPVAAQTPGPAPYTNGHAARPRVLLVEDNDAIRGLLGHYLESRGFEVYRAASGDEALQVWEERKKSADILVTDIVMPGQTSGPQLAVQLLQDAPELKVVYMSGYANDESMRGVHLEEGVNFLAKPFAPADLAAIVHKTLAASGN
ncbi:MAG: response regulator [Verrucomicrobia bacterium]|nr:response regulator [Verrucomicrobiota bacterium]